MTSHNKKITKLRQRVRDATKALKDGVKQAQFDCKHAALAECDYLPMNFSSLSPMRVCLNCGMTENGWGCGYVVLCGDAKRISRDEVYALRAGLAITDHDKGLLLRREVTVRELVEKKEWP